MQFSGDRLSHERVYVSAVKVSHSDGVKHLGHILRQKRYSDRRREILAIHEIEGKSMELLTNETKYGEGRGRQSVDSTFELDNLLDALSVENVEDAANVLDGRFVAAVRGEDWQGNVSGAKRELQKQLKGTPIVASFRNVEGADRLTTIKFTLRRSLDSVENGETETDTDENAA